MSGITLDDIANEEMENRYPSGEFEREETIVEQQPSKVNEMLTKVITASTGPGSIETYMDHPLNFSGSKGLAQIIRGLSGLITNLDLAIIDIVMGGLRFSKEKRGVNDGIGVSGGGNLHS